MKTVLITGAGRGLGLEIAKQELHKGSFVIATYRTFSEDLSILESKYGDHVKIIRMDINDSNSVAVASSEVGKIVDRIDIIYNNAGVLNKGHKNIFKNIIFDDSVLNIVNTNSFGFIRVIQGFYNFIKQNTMIIVISSGAGSIKSAIRNNYDISSVNIPYYISKAGLNIGACLLKHDLKKIGADILLIDPGRIKTDMGGKNAFVDINDSVKNILLFSHKEIKPKSIFIDFNGNEIEL